MNKAELTRFISHKTGVARGEVESVLDWQAKAVADELSGKDGEVTLYGIGKLKTSERAARNGRNPQTGEAIQIPACRVVKLSVAKALKDAV